MQHLRPNVLPLYSPPRQKTFRAAVAKIIRDIKARESLTNVELAEEIGCSADTVSNAENENNDLSAVTLLRIAYEFGEEAIAPVRELYLCRHAEPPTVAEDFDDLEAALQRLRRKVEP